MLELFLLTKLMSLSILLIVQVIWRVSIFSLIISTTSAQLLNSCWEYLFSENYFSKVTLPLCILWWQVGYFVRVYCMYVLYCCLLIEGINYFEFSTWIVMLKCFKPSNEILTNKVKNLLKKISILMEIQCSLDPT